MLAAGRSYRPKSSVSHRFLALGAVEDRTTDAIHAHYEARASGGTVTENPGKKMVIGFSA
jgi:hypothetical protein